jgi:hypothetical protein
VQAVTGYTHEYKRHATTTLCAALNVATGEVQAAHINRQGRVKVLRFMNQVVARRPGRKIHVVFDNLSSHKPKHDRWLVRHQHVDFNYTPTHASWLNRIDIGLGKLSRDEIQGAGFTPPVNSGTPLTVPLSPTMSTPNRSNEAKLWLHRGHRGQVTPNSEARY